MHNILSVNEEGTCGQAMSRDTVANLFQINVRVRDEMQMNEKCSI